MSTFSLKGPPTDDEDFPPEGVVEDPYEKGVTLDLPDMPDLKDVSHLKDLNLESELLLQYKQTRALFRAVKNLNSVPLNQKAQLLGVLLTVTKRIVDTQKELHNVETFKLMESVLVETLKEFPDISKVFLDRYEAALALH